MGKKGKDKKKAEDAGGGAGGDGADGGVNVDELNAKIVLLEKEKNKEEEYRNYMQLERDKISSFWEITKKDLDDRRAEVRNKDREMEEMEERHQVEIKVYKQKVKHLLYEHQNNITTLKTEGETALKLQQDGFHRVQADLQKDKRALKQEMREMELAHEDYIRQLQLEHAKEITMIRKEFELNAKELQQKYEKHMKKMRDELELRRKLEVHEIEDRKNSHIQDLMKRHEKAFADIKNYYNDITHNNLDLIKALKEDVAEMKKSEANSQKLMYEIAQENKRLQEPLQKALKECDMLRQQLHDYEKDKMSLSQTKARLGQTEKLLKNLEWEHEVFQQRFAQVQKERDELYGRFETTVYDIQQRAGLKAMIAERKLETLQETVEKKDAQISEILAASNLDQSTLSAVTKKLDEVLEGKNQLIKALQYDVAKVSKAHNDIIRVYEAKLAEFGVPVEELGFRPLITTTTVGPAGLVVGS